MVARSGGFLLVVSLGGCRDVPDRVHLPSIDANDAGIACLEQYDTNSDGKIDADELNDAPSLRSALGRLDSDTDGAVSAAEITARIERWQEINVGLTQVNCQVSYNGQPLVGATITFEPEEFLGDGVQACIGLTNQQGNTMLSIPGAQHNLPGGAPGFYRIKITSPNIELPEEYNTRTTLGAEIASDSAAVERGVVLNLRK
jgi:hypothetical protein